MTDTPPAATLDQRVQAAVRDALRIVARNPAADPYPEVSARLVASAVLAVLAEVHRQPPADLAVAAAAFDEAADTVEAMNEGCSRARPCASCDAREDAADALRDIAHRRGAAPRDGLSTPLGAPHAAEHPTPGPERHPGGENGQQTGTESRDCPCTGECDPTTGAYTHKPGCPNGPDRRQRYARVIHRYDYDHGLSGNDIPSKHHYGEAAAVLAVADAETAQLREELDRARRIGVALENDEADADQYEAQLREELRKAKRAANLLADAHRRAEQVEAERDSLGRETDRLRRDWTTMRDRAERAAAAIARVRALHHDWDADPGHCAHCQDGMGTPLPWPCPTIRALDAPTPADDAPCVCGHRHAHHTAGPRYLGCDYCPCTAYRHTQQAGDDTTEQAP